MTPLTTNFSQTATKPPEIIGFKPSNRTHSPAQEREIQNKVKARIEAEKAKKAKEEAERRQRLGHVNHIN